MQASLAKSVHAVRVEDEVVFLDLRANAYLIFSDAERAVELSPGTRALGVGDATLGEELANAGLITAAVAPVAVRRPTLPTRSLASQSASKPSLRVLSEVAWAMSHAPGHYGARSLRGLVRFATRRSRGLRPDPALAAERARLFNALLPWSPFQGDCLFRSHLMLRFLRAGGADADWVFAVRTWPFAAHCWLQTGDLVLNDRAENLAAFRPILVA